MHINVLTYLCVHKAFVVLDPSRDLRNEMLD